MDSAVSRTPLRVRYGNEFHNNIEALVSDDLREVENWGCGYFGDRISSRLRSNGVIKTEPLTNKTLSLQIMGNKVPRTIPDSLFPVELPTS